MANLGVYLTVGKKILVVSCPSALPVLLGKEDTVKQSWFYSQPPELEAFFKQWPEEKKLFEKALAYWISTKAFKKKENQNKYGILKRYLDEFNADLLSKIQGLVNLAVKKIKNFWYRQEKKIKKALEQNNLRVPKKRSYFKKLCY